MEDHQSACPPDSFEESIAFIFASTIIKSGQKRYTAKNNVLHTNTVIRFKLKAK
jgi:hypothetical protein